MRSFDAAIGFVAACSLALGFGCVTVEAIHRPPTPAEIDRVNAAQGPLVVEMLPAAGPSATIDHVVSADAAKIVVAPEHGPPYPLRLDDVFLFSARTEGRGAAVGAGVGAGVAAGITMSFGFLIYAKGAPDPNAPPCSGCVARAFLEVGLVSGAVGGAVGALIGAVVGSRHEFLIPGPAPPPPPRPLFFNPGPPPLPPSRPSTPAGKSSASVVAPSADHLVLGLGMEPDGRFSRHVGGLRCEP